MIKCSWASQNKFAINPDGQVFPCCYLATLVFIDKIFLDIDRYDEVIPKHQQEHKHYVIQEYLKSKSNLNIHYNSIDTILNSEWFTKILPESLLSYDTANGKCIHFCGDKHEDS